MKTRKCSIISSISVRRYIKYVRRNRDWPLSHDIGIAKYWKRLLFQQLLPFLQTRTEKSFLFITRVYGRRIHGSGSEGPNAGACNLVPTGEHVWTDDWAIATDLIPCQWFRKENLRSIPRNRVFFNAFRAFWRHYAVYTLLSCYTKILLIFLLFYTMTLSFVCV